MPLDQIDVDNLPEAEKEMSFFGHIAELRGHLVRSAIAICVMFVVIFCYGDFIFNNIIFAPTKSDFPTYRFFTDVLHLEGFEMPKIEIKTMTLGEAFVTHMMIAFWLALSITFPYLVWEVWRFIKPGLYNKEQKAARGMVAIVGGLFFVGLLFGYYVASPLAIVFLAGYKIPGVESIVTLESYIDSLVMFTIPLGFVFELPVIMYFLGKIGIVNAKLLRNSRRYAIVILMIISGFITPSPDAWSMFVVFIPLYILYELSIFIVAKEERKLIESGDAFLDDEE
jgi:sec-independent protein translocase protein TatC